MPQPVHHSRPIHFEFLPASVLQRPELAVHIAAISARWNEIEARVGAFLAALAGSEAATVIAVYVAIKNDGAKRSTVDTISALHLSASDYARFQDILKRVGKVYIERNTVIHGAWGISSDYPDKLLWADIRRTTMMHVEMMKITNGDEIEKRNIEEQKKFFVYGLSDFLEIERRINEVYQELCAYTRPFIEKGIGLFGKVDLKPT